MRRSCQTIARCSGSPVAGSHTQTVSRWLVIPTAASSARAHAGVVERLARHRLRDLPDLRGVVLDPAGPREVLGELPVGPTAQLEALVEDEARGAGRALVDGEDHRGVGGGGYCLGRNDDQEAPDVAAVEAHITGTVWKIECAVGDRIEEGDTVAILESMKMEMPVEAEDAGTVTEILCTEGQAVNEGDTLVVLE